MKSVCLVFQVHQPFSLRRYRFFDIGTDHYYYDDFANETNFQKIAALCYLPANAILLRHIRRLKGKFRVAFYISGVTLEQMALYSPEVRQSFRELAETGCVEFLSGTYSHSLSSIAGFEAFSDQVKRHWEAVFEFTGQFPGVFLNTEMIYSDEIGAMIAEMGIKAVITEGARHILGWKSPNYVYCNAVQPRLKVLMRNFNLSDDLSVRFSDPNKPEYPLTPEKFISRIAAIEQEDAIVNICAEYETFGVFHSEKTGIFNFLDHFIFLAAQSPDFDFSTPSEAASRTQPVSLVNVPDPVSWAEEERDLALWTGNDLQNEALIKLYESAPLVKAGTDPGIIRDWQFLQSCDHFYFMTTKQLTQSLHHRRNPYNSPFEAFINYMNVLSDFRLRLNQQIPGNSLKVELDYLKNLLNDKDKQIKKYKEELQILQKEKDRKKS